MSTTPTFKDTFTTLSLWNGSTGNWQPAYDWSPDGYIDSTMSSWFVNPAYGPTTQADADIYSINGNGLNMAIEALPSNVSASAVGGAQFLSGQLTTEPSFSQTYGYFQMTAELPTAASGISSAFWLLPESGAWPPEIDIFEADGSQGANAIETGVFTGSSSDAQQTYQWDYSLPNLTTSYNTFALNWTATTMTWYVDGKAVYQIATPSDMNQPMYMLLDDLTNGGGWNGAAAAGYTGDMSIKSVYAFDNMADAETAGVVPGVSGSSTGSGSTGSTGTGNTGTGSTGSGSTGTTLSSNDLAVAVPASEKLVAGTTTAVSGISVTDPWAAANTGTMALSVWDSTGTLSVNGHSIAPGGGPVAGGMFTGSLAQIDADLASLTYTAAASGGSDTISVNVWNQAGVEATETIPVTVTAATIKITASNADPIELVSNDIITATSGAHMLFVGGTGDTITLTGAKETVQAFEGHNTITTGGQADTIQIAGMDNVVNAGAGQNTIDDSGSDNTIVLPAAQDGDDTVHGLVMQNGDTFDLRALLAATSWNGSQSTIANFIRISTSNGGAVISVTPTGAVSGGKYAVATLENSGSMSLTTLLAHSIT